MKSNTSDLVIIVSHDTTAADKLTAAQDAVVAARAHTQKEAAR